MTGVVKRIKDGKYFGFIRSNIDGKEYFFHRSDFTGFWDDLESDVSDKNNLIPVEFDVVDSAKGPRAANVRRLDYPNQAV